MLDSGAATMGFVRCADVMFVGRPPRFIIRRLRAPRWRRLSMGSFKRACSFFPDNAIALRAMDVYSEYSHSAPVRSERPLEARGLRFSASRSVFRGARAVNGELEFGRIFVRGVGWSSNFRERARALGFLEILMELREGFMTAF